MMKTTRKKMRACMDTPIHVCLPVVALRVLRPGEIFFVSILVSLKAQGLAMRKKRAPLISDQRALSPKDGLAMQPRGQPLESMKRIIRR